MSTVPVLKVIIAGDGNVGKTSLIRRYCEGKFEQSRVATIGVDFQTKLVELPNRTVKLSIWDMAGQDRFQVLRGGFYRGALAAALVYDMTNHESLDHLPHWREEITKVVPDIPFIVVGNKLDLVAEGAEDPGVEYAARVGAPHLNSSALDGTGVAKLFKGLAYLAAPRAQRRAS